MTSEEKILAWHFLKDDRKLRFFPYTEVTPGSIVTATGELMMCNNGCHASIEPLDALKYAPGPIVCRVEVFGEILKGSDKLCARHRNVLWMADATNALQEFACCCVEQALFREHKAGRDTDQRSWIMIDAKRGWLRGEVSDEELHAAWVEARAGRKAIDTRAANDNWPAEARSAAWNAAHAATRLATSALDMWWYIAWVISYELIENVQLVETMWGLSTCGRLEAQQIIWEEQNTKLKELLQNLKEV